MKYEEIKYNEPDPESIFDPLEIKDDSEYAFENAIKMGMKNPEDWMYMYSVNDRDYFKHIYTRNYISYPQEEISEGEPREQGEAR